MNTNRTVPASSQTSASKRLKHSDLSASTKFISYDEAMRLSALRDLNVEPAADDDRFYRIVRIAAAHFQMPICKISIIDHERNWYKASVGTEETECNRAKSICNFAIQSDKPLIIPDLSADDRFSGLPQVVGGKKFRFYAGAPIIVENGARVGSLCMMDVVPHHHVSEEDIRFLVDLSEVVARELVLQRNSAQRVQQLIDFDPLTGLCSRMFIQTQLQLSILHARKSSSQMAAICIDIDDFTEINDARGVFFGDKYLKAFADRLSDLTPRNINPGRLSGDKFLLVVNSIASQSELDQMTTLLLEQLCAPLEIDGEQFQCSCSFGVAMGPPEDGKAITLQKHADWALHYAKADGKAQMRVFTPALYASAMKRLELAIDLKAADLDQHFELYYQPFMDLQTDKVIGYEALLRWNHPQRGMVFPGEFISIAEETRMIDAIGEWVLKQACLDAARWKNNEFVSVNLSPSQFQSHDITASIRSALIQSGLKPDRLEVEITENALISDFETVNSKLSEISELGVSIALDDFGTGYSSLNYLAALRFDKLKIDKIFIDRMGHDTKVRNIIKMIIELAYSLDTQIVAEGIETLAQSESIRRIGCQIGQGYLYGRPAPLKAASKASQPAEPTRVLANA